MQRRKDQQLQDGADHKKTYRSAENFRNKEKPRASAMRPFTETVFKVAVDSSDIFAVKQRHKDKSNGKITHYKAQHHLKIGIAFGSHHAGHRDERDARNGGPNHGEGYQTPMVVSFTGKKSGIVAPSRRKPAYAHEHKKIGGYGYDYDYR